MMMMVMILDGDDDKDEREVEEVLGFSDYDNCDDFRW